MHVAVEGTKMYFATQKPNFKKHWEEDGVATPGSWHRIAMHVQWSSDPGNVQVDLWLDGRQVVTAARAQTYLGNPAFVQQGILRTPTIDKVETLYMDDARLGTTLADVMPASTGGSGGSARTSASPVTGGAQSSMGGAGSPNVAGSPNGAGNSTSGPNGDAPGCGCRTAPSQYRMPWAALLLGAILLRRRR